ncbi:MAG: CHRD domain-containing protein [Bryobacteraceae bacterium]
MKKFLASIILAAGVLLAQTAETIPFRAILLPGNEVPPVAITASGAATVWLHVVRDAAGKVTSASTDFNVSYRFPGETRITGLHIHDGAAGVNGPIRIDSGISAATPVPVDSTGQGVINRQGQTLATNTDGLATVSGILTNPSGFYVNLHTVENPGGVIRGQLMQAESVVLVGLMNPRNEVPPIPDLNASGVGSVVALMTRGTDGSFNSGQVIFDLNYTGFPEGTRFTGFHIHDGAAGVNGPVTINTGIQGGDSALPAQTGGGNLHYEVEVPMSNAAASGTLQGLFRNPAAHYINLHTLVNPGGAIRSQLRKTDMIRYPVTMLPGNEVPPITGLDASAPALVTAHTVRGADGSVTAGVVTFDINHRFPGATTFTGLHIHDGAAGVNGPVTINSGISSIVSDTGVGNIYRTVTVSSMAGLATLNSMVQNPENQLRQPAHHGESGWCGTFATVGSTNQAPYPHIGKSGGICNGINNRRTRRPNQN